MFTVSLEVLITLLHSLPWITAMVHNFFEELVLFTLLVYLTEKMMLCQYIVCDLLSLTISEFELISPGI
jgi:hypothetical protein